MKKFVKACIAVALAGLMVVSLTACSKFGSIRKAFEKEGYTYSEETNSTLTSIVDELAGEGTELTVTPHLFTKTLSVVIIIEFKSNDDIDKALEESSTLKGLLKDAQKSDYVNGNCVCIPLDLLNYSGILEIFKNA